MPQKSLAMRAVMALVLSVGFYVLAIGIAAGLLAAVYVEIVYAHHILIKATILAVVGAGLILWSILPRFDRFVPPGPRLDADDQPDLFAVIRDVAAKTEQEMPREVYLIPEVNAWVAQRGGIAGIGSRRVMGVGLALMQSVNVPQFRAIIAHEFGHYHGGDTTLGPWIYKTRMAIGRTVENLSGSSLHKPFLAYGKMFLRVTQAISRAQECAADMLAAKVAGPRASIDALIITHRAGAAYDSYWSGEVLPVLSNGFLPPIAAGLRQFMSCEDVDKALGAMIEREMAEGKAEEFDSHPPLRERVALLEPLAAGEQAADGPCALTLLRNVAALEAALVRPMFNDPNVASQLQSLNWDETPAQVYVPLWRKRVEEHAGVLRELNMVGVSDMAKALPQFAVRLNLRHMPPEEANAAAEAVLGCAIVTRLLDEGWSCDAPPGAAVTMHKDGRSFTPFLDVRRIAGGELTAEQWAAQCESAGVAAHPLA